MAKGLAPELRYRLRKALDEIEQIFVDAGHWNRTHPDEDPIDPDPDGELARWKAWAQGRLEETG